MIDSKITHGNPVSYYTMGTSGAHTSGSTVDKNNYEINVPKGVIKKLEKTKPTGGYATAMIVLDYINSALFMNSFLSTNSPFK